MTVIYSDRKGTRVKSIKARQKRKCAHCGEDIKSKEQYIQWGKYVKSKQGSWAYFDYIKLHSKCYDIVRLIEELEK